MPVLSVKLLNVKTGTWNIFFLCVNPRTRIDPGCNEVLLTGCVCFGFCTNKSVGYTFDDGGSFMNVDSCSRSCTGSGSGSGSPLLKMS